MDIHGHPVILLIVIISILVATSYNPALLQAGVVERGHIEFESNCKECHTPWRGAPDQKCIDCHREDETKKDPVAHGEECKTCHFEHKGRSVTIGQFDHSAVNYELAEDHNRVVCNECHSYGYLINTVPACLDCHNPDMDKEEFNITQNQVVIKRACIHCHKKAQVDLTDFKIEDWI